MTIPNDVFKDILPDRNDEACLRCGSGHVTSIPYIKNHRKVGDRHIQNIWKCKICGNIVITLDEIKDQPCPTCGTEGMFSKTEIEQMEAKP